MLRKAGTGWEFENEALLEDCLKRHLETLLGLKVIAQQQTIQGQVCDLVAVSETGQLAILELKNQEDRYIVQQLTRYFDAFHAEKSFADRADYSQPMRLLAIAPSFHRDNFRLSGIQYARSA
jgi:RecB family endonuclease NucS